MPDTPELQPGAKAFMSVRDADLLEHTVRALRRRHTGRLCVVEWGSGASTVYFTALLSAQARPFLWLSLENDRGFYERSVAPALRAQGSLLEIEEHDLPAVSTLVGSDRCGVVVAIVERGPLFPFEPARDRDRGVDLDAYVDLPRRLGIGYDLCLVDGRKRRRCLLESSTMLAVGGVTLLHDAWRSHYHCALPAFASGRLIGDELWIGAQTLTDFTDLLPGHAFGSHLTSARPGSRPLHHSADHPDGAAADHDQDR